MRRLLALSLAVAGLLALAALAGVGRPDAARGDTSPASNLVTTNGHGVVNVVPNEATISAGVSTTASTAAAALAANARIATAVVAALGRAGGTEIQTQQVSLDPQTNQKAG